MTKEEQTDDLVIQEGDCFGWYSSVSSDCQPNRCTQSERCKQYTLRMQQSGDNPSLLKELEEFEKTEKKEKEKEKNKKQSESKKKDGQLVNQAYFSQALNLVKTMVEHDNVHVNEKNGYASVKKDGHLVAFINRTQKNINVVIGNPKNTKEKCELEIGEDLDVIRRRLTQFIERQIR